METKSTIPSTLETAERCSVPPNVFDVFEDRVLSLLERWKKPELDIPPEQRVQHCLAEIGDDFSKFLAEGSK